MNTEIINQVETFLAANPEDGEARLELFLQTGQVLYSTDDIIRMTGWSRSYINRLCREKRLAYIPGNPNKFLLNPLIQSLEDMVIGGRHGRKRRTTK